MERCSASQLLTLGTLIPLQEAEKLVPLLSHLATAREQRVLLGPASLPPFVLDLITLELGDGCEVLPRNSRHLLVGSREKGQ